MTTRSDAPTARSTMFDALVSLVVLLPTACGYGRGAPYASCISQYPQHDSLPLTAPSPYQLVVSAETYGPGSNISVTISGPVFIGFSLSARRSDGDTEELIGSFINYPTEHAQAVNCLGGDRNLVTHTNPSDKSNTTFIWRFGSGTAGDIHFRATVLKTETIFWTPIVSPKIIDLSKNGEPGFLEPVDHSFPEMNLEKACGKTMGCFLNPMTCTGSACTSAVSYQTDGDVIHFHMMGESDGYVSVGFSKDEFMGDDDVVSCIAVGSKVMIQHGYNVGYTYQRQYARMLTNKATAKRDGKIYCRFTRPVSMASVKVLEDYDGAHAPQEIITDLSNGSILFLATGKIFADGEDLTIHDSTPSHTADAVDFKKFVVQRGVTMSVLEALHGVFMVLAWVLFASIATVGGRYFRQGFGSKKVGGLLLWFQMHRAMTIGACVLTIAGFVIIFVKDKGLTTDAPNHANTGIAVMAAVLAQVLMGLLRPGPGTKKRLYFNWAHRILGKSTHLLAAVCLILAFRMRSLAPPMRQFGTTVIAVWISVQLVWEICLEINRFCLSRPAVEDLDQAKKEKQAPPKPNGRLLMALFTLYLLTLVACTVAALCAILLF